MTAAARWHEPASRALAGGSVAQALAEGLVRLGATHAFGVTGSAIASFAHALSCTSITMIDCRHESGAAFAATEASLATGRTAVVFTTAGPGLTNVLTGMLAARWEGPRVVLVSGATSTAHGGRWAIQDTRVDDGRFAPLYGGRPLFHYATTLDSPDHLPAVLAALAAGARRAEGFVAHVSLPVNVQSLAAPVLRARPCTTASPPRASATSLAPKCARLLAEDGFVIWVGFGARDAAADVRELAERTQARVLCSPRAKGIFPESHPLFLGVSGIGGHEAVATALARDRPARILVLGSRLGEATSLWSPAYVPSKGFVHVDVDASVFAAAYPGVPTIGVEEDCRTFVPGLLAHWTSPAERSGSFPARVARAPIAPRREPGVRPRYLMSLVQRRVVDETRFVVMAESGNALLWTTHCLTFDEPRRFRVSPGFGSMGHMATGVVGAALAERRKAIAIVGDGSMLMQSEVSTAVQHGAPAVWIVLNDARYGIVAQGMRDLGWPPVGAAIAPADFALVARGLGCDAARVVHEELLDEALRRALTSEGPFVLDVVIARDEAPNAGRQSTLVQQLWAGPKP